MKKQITLLGAGGKMGCRILDHLKECPEYTVRCVESGERGLQHLAARGYSGVPRDEALAGADAVILAVPDRVLGAVSEDIVPRLPSGCLLVLLDPAAAHAGVLAMRDDIGYFISHPCHSNIFDHFETDAERADFFGGVHARQAIVCALMQGTEAHYGLGESLACAFYGPVTRSHRITVEQMAILEPALAETVSIALLATLREALDEAVRRGVPRAAAEDFLYGHIKVELGILFNQANFPFSDGAQLIAKYGRERLIRSDWKQVFEPESVLEQVRAIVKGVGGPQNESGARSQD